MSKETFHITIDYFPSDNYNDRLSIKKEIPKQELRFTQNNIEVMLLFKSMWDKINKAI